MRVGIALGSNLGDRISHLHAAVAAIREFAAPPILVSRIYETDPVNCPPNSPVFLNAAMEIGYSGDIEELMVKLQAIESSEGRPRIRSQNSPRTIDLDILYADDLTMQTPLLTLPHPRISERAFVILPLNDIAPGRRLPNGAKSFSELAAEISNSGCKVLQDSIL